MGQILEFYLLSISLKVLGLDVLKVEPLMHSMLVDCDKSALALD